MSCEGTAIGWPLAGLRMLLLESINTAASICASGLKRNVHSHLVAVEVRVESRTDERMNLDRLAFNQHRLESLNAQTVQRRRAVQQHRDARESLLRECPRPPAPGARPFRAPV